MLPTSTQNRALKFEIATKGFSSDEGDFQRMMVRLPYSYSFSSSLNVVLIPYKDISIRCFLKAGNRGYRLHRTGLPSPGLYEESLFVLDMSLSIQKKKKNLKSEVILIASQ